MQTMNSDQQIYYSTSTGPHQPVTGYYTTNPMDTQFSMRSPNTYGQSPRMSQQFFNGQMPNPYVQQQQQQYYYQQQPYLHNPSFPHTNGTRGMNPSYVSVIRPSNETSNGTQTYIPQTPYSPYIPPNTLVQTQNVYSSPQYGFQIPQTYAQQTPSTQISNQSQSQYAVPNNQQQTQSSQTSQQSPLEQQHGQSSQTSYSKEKRERKPIRIVDPNSGEALKMETSTPSVDTSSNTTAQTDDKHQNDSITDSTMIKSKSIDEINKTQIQADFRQKVARLINPNSQIDKNTIEETSPTEDVIPQSTSSASSSRSGSISNKSSEKPLPSHPGVRTRSGAEENSNSPTNEDETEQDQSDSPAPITTESINSTSTSNDTTENPTNEIDNEVPVTESLENVTSTPSNDTESESVTIEQTPSTSRRHGYTIQELLSKRSAVISKERPTELISLPGVTTPPPPPKQPIKPLVKPKVDGNIQFLRDVKSILNKVTPTTYAKLLQKLDNLELNSFERLEGMITVLFVKAVEAAIFCSLYADICKFFQKKQVTVPDENGQPVTHYFRQILLTRCQKEFESDYRESIDYEKRKTEVDAIEDEKVRREAAEQLEEDLFKAKRKTLGNIIFIGELFKLQILTAPIMYDCVEYLLRDKTDEENLECLCRLLTTIGKELEIKANERPDTRKNLEKSYADLVNIGGQRQTTARIRFMIQDLMDLRKANWVARRNELKPTTIDEIHEQDRAKREQEDNERHQRRDYNRGSGSNNPQQYTGSRGSRGSGIKQQSNRTDNDRIDNRVIVNSLRQFHSNDKRNPGQGLNLAPQGAWSKGSGVEKKPEDDRSNTGRTSKPPAGVNQQFRPKTGTSPGTPGYSVQRQPSRELSRGNPIDALRKTANEPTTPNNTSATNSRESSRNPSPESGVNERTLSSTITTTDPVKTAFDEEKTQARVHSLIEEYTENYSDNNERPVNEATEDLTSFCTANIDQQGIIVRELFTNVLEAKPRARKAVGHLLDVALHKNVISTEGFLSGIKLFIEVVPDYAVDIPRIWQYIGEIIGAFIGAPSSNMLLLKEILQSISDVKSKQLFEDIIRYAIEFSSKTHIQKFWQASGFSLNDLLPSDSIDSSFINEYNWLSEPIEVETTEVEITEVETPPVKETLVPHADPQLIKLFKSVNDQGTIVNDDDILLYIHENMKSNEKFYTRNIVLSYLEACLINREPQKKIQEDIAKSRMTILNAIIKNQPEEEIQAVYAIQNFVHKLEHPKKMAQLLFDIFYDAECVTEETFFEWLNKPDQSETEGHSVVEISTKDFFDWLQQADTEPEGGEAEEN